jgi:hypothetical protein
MYNPFDFRTFIDSVKEMDYLDIIKAAERRCYELESISYGQKGAVRAREMGSTRLAEQLKGLLFWLRTGQKPNGLADGDFASLRVICESLVRKQQLKPEALDVFGSRQQ